MPSRHVLMFMVGGLLTPVVLGVALWLGALLNLALLLPFAAVARRLRVAPERPHQPRAAVPGQASR